MFTSLFVLVIGIFLAIAGMFAENREGRRTFLVTGAFAIIIGGLGLIIC